MTSPTDISTDHEYPQLREIVDPQQLAQMLQHYIVPSHPLQVEACMVLRVRYKRGGSCRVLITATIRHRGTEERDEQLFFGNLYRHRRAEAVYASLDREQLVAPQFGPPVLYIPEWKMILWAYPNDPHLPGMSFMVESVRVLARMRAAPNAFGLQQQPVRISAELKKYVPGMRCGYLYHLELPAQHTRGRTTWRAVYGKAYQGAKGNKAYAIMQHIWCSDARRMNQFRLPEPYSYDAERHILWQEAIAGESLAKIVTQQHQLADLAGRIGQCLAAFHGLQLDLPHGLTFDQQVHEVQTAIRAIQDVFPHYAARCHALGLRLEAVAVRLGPAVVTPVHGSFKFSHIFSTQQGIVFIDFDGASLGDPGYDLGRFIAHLYKMQASKKIDRHVAEQTITNFCAAYTRAARSHVSQERINWFAASHLISSQIYKAVKRMETSLLSRLLDRAEALCPAADMSDES